MSDRSWLIESTFLQRLPAALAEKVLRLCQERRMAPTPGRSAQPLLQPGERAALLLLKGQAMRNTPGEFNPERIDTGRLMGAGWMLDIRDDAPELLATSPVDYLVFPASMLDALAPEDRTTLLGVLKELDELDYVVDKLEHRLRKEPTLRRLYAHQRIQLLQASTTEDVTPLDILLEKGRVASRLPLLLVGTAQAWVGAKSQLAFPAGALLGAYADWTHKQPRQPYRILPNGRARVLWLPVATLRCLAARNPWFHRASTREHGAARGSATLINACEASAGATTLALALAVHLALDPDNGTKDVAVLDLDGARTCKALGRTGTPVARFGGPCHLVDLELGHRTVLIWPGEGTDPDDVLDALLSEFEEVLISHATGHPPREELLEDVHTAVLLSASLADHAALPLGEHQRRIHAIRQPAEPYPARRARVRGYKSGPPFVTWQPMTSFVQIPWDPSCGDAMTGKVPLKHLASPHSPMARAAARLGRMIQGRSRGVALSGGGAWGFVHLGLLRALHECNMEPDFVSGTSIGSVVGAVYCGGPQTEAIDRIDTLERTRQKLSINAQGCIVNSAFVGRYIEGITGVQHIYQPEVPLIAVSADVYSNSRFVPWTGSLSDAVRAASSFPGVFTPFNRGKHRLVDGGVVENLPALVLGRNADFVLASNCIPDRRDPDAKPMPRPPVIGRFIDAASALFLLMGQASRQDEGASDFAFVPTGHTKNLPMDFAHADQTAALGYQLAMDQMGAIKAAYEADLTTHRAGG